MEPRNEGGVVSGRLGDDATGSGFLAMAVARILQASSVVIGAEVVVSSVSAAAADEAMIA